MIALTRISGQPFVLNCDLIERIDVTPDTVVSLVDGKKYVVLESSSTSRRSDPALPRARSSRSATTSRPRTWASSTTTSRPTCPPSLRSPGRCDGSGTRHRHRRRLRGRHRGERDGGRQPDEPPADRPDPARLRHHRARDDGRRHDEGRQDGRRARLKRAFTGNAASAEELIPAVVDLAERARREGLLALEDAVKGRRRRVPAQGRHDGHRRHRPRGAPRDPRVRGLRQAGRRQAGREVLRRRRRLRADHRHHRHRHGPGARAREPGRARPSSAT